MKNSRGGKREERKYSRLAVASFLIGLFILFSFVVLIPFVAFGVVLAIVILVEIIIFLGIPGAIISIIFGIIALRKIKKNKNLKGKYLAIAGIVISVLTFIVYIMLAMLGASIAG